MAWTFCSKNDVVSMHPVPVTDLQDAWSEMVEGLIRDYMGMPYLGESETVTGEWHDGSGSNVLVVNKPPIVSVTSLTVSDRVLAADEYVVFDNYVQLKAGVFPAAALNTQITYVSGSTTVSPAVRMAATAMIISIINYRKRSGADSSMKWGTNDPKVGEETPNQNVGLTSHLTQIMRRLLKRSSILVK